MTERTPNLFLIGAQKAGSTNLADHLRQSPDIEYFGKKEPNIFSEGTAEKARAKLASYDIGSVTAPILLDGSPNYTRFPAFPMVPELIKEMLGAEGLKFIYIMRNPVERLISHYFWNRQRYGESQPLMEALEKDSRYVDGSRYDMQLERYLAHFPKEAFRFVKFEDYVRDPFRNLCDLLDWLGAAPPIAFNPNPGFVAATDKKETREARIPQLNRLIRSSRILRGIATNLVSAENQLRINRLLSRSAPREDVDCETKQEILHRYFIDSIERTQALTGLDLGDWRTAFETPTEQEKEEA